MWKEDADVTAERGAAGGRRLCGGRLRGGDEQERESGDDAAA
jgi:hypothetical protein